MPTGIFTFIFDAYCTAVSTKQHEIVEGSWSRLLTCSHVRAIDGRTCLVRSHLLDVRAGTPGRNSPKEEPSEKLPRVPRVEPWLRRWGLWHLYDSWCILVTLWCSA